MDTQADPLFEHWLLWLESGALAPELEAERHRDPAGFERRRTSVQALLQSLEAARFEPLTASELEASREVLRRERARQAPPLLDRVAAVARRVLGPGASALALRSGALSGRFQALYAFDGFEVDLAEGDDGRLRGQVLGLDGAPLPEESGVHLFARGAALCGAALDEAGGFVLTPPRGVAFELWVQLGPRSALIPDLPALL